MERCGEPDCDEESFAQRALGVRLCRWCQPSIGVEGFAEPMQLLPRKFYCWGRNVWRPGRCAERRSARYISLPRSRNRLETSVRLDCAPLERFWFERQQPPVIAALGSIARILRLWRFAGAHLWRQAMRFAEWSKAVGCVGLTVVLLISGIGVVGTSRALARENQKSVYAILNDAPEKAKNKQNPFAGDPEAVAAGGKLFEQHCAECHGKKAGGTMRGANLLNDEMKQAA